MNKAVEPFKKSREALLPKKNTRLKTFLQYKTSKQADHYKKIRFQVGLCVQNLYQLLFFFIQYGAAIIFLMRSTSTHGRVSKD